MSKHGGWIEQLMDALYERLFDLRNAQANCPASDRAKYEKEIAEIMKKIDALRS